MALLLQTPLRMPRLADSGPKKRTQSRQSSADLLPSAHLADQETPIGSLGEYFAEDLKVPVDRANAHSCPFPKLGRPVWMTVVSGTGGIHQRSSMRR